jgi:maltose/moltooligosaccharide transporter
MNAPNSLGENPITASSAKPTMSFWQIFNMSFGFLGIQFGFELQNSNVSRIFETLGANKDDIPILWIAAPLTGLLVQPIIGYLSDRTWHPYWGRRRPYFFIGAILATLALFIMPNSSALWMAGGMLWILDASINISMEPFRAFVGDKLNAKQRTRGFAMQSFFIGIGSVIAALLPWMFSNWFGISSEMSVGKIPDSVKYSFYFGGIAFFGAVMYTVFTTKEFPPESLEQFKKEKKETTFKDGLNETFGGILKMPKTMKQLAIVQFFTWFALFAMWIYATNAVTANKYDMKVDTATLAAMDAGRLADSISISKSIESLKSSSTIDNIQLSEFTKKQKTVNSLASDFKEIKEFRADQNPVTISVNLANYFSDSLNTATTIDQKASLKRVQAEYNKGADWLSVCSSVRNGMAAIFAFIIPLIAARTNRKITHMICLIIGGLGLISIYFITNPTFILVSMAMVGIAWASILSMPYAMLSNALPSNKMGYFMGVFNFFIVIPQIVAASILGFFTMKFFHANTLNTIVLGGVSMIVAGLLTLMVKDADDE